MRIKFKDTEFTDPARSVRHVLIFVCTEKLIHVDLMRGYIGIDFTHPGYDEPVQIMVVNGCGVMMHIDKSRGRPGRSYIQFDQFQLLNFTCPTTIRTRCRPR